MTKRMEHLISKTMNGALNRHKKQHFRAKNSIRVLHIYENISDVESLLLFFGERFSLSVDLISISLSAASHSQCFWDKRVCLAQED